MSNYSTLYQLPYVSNYSTLYQLCVKLFNIASIIYQIIQHYIYNVFKLFNIASGMYQIIQHSNKTSFNGYLNNAVIKLLIYFNSSMHIARQIMDFIPKRLSVYIYRTIVHTNIKIWFVSLYIHLLGLLCLTPLSIILKLYRGDQFHWWRKPEYSGKNPPTCCEAKTNLYHITLHRCHERDSNLRL